MPKIKWSADDVQHLRLLIEAYAPFVDLGPGDVMMGFERKFPLELPIVNEHYEVEGSVIISTHREYFDFLDHNRDEALRRFQVLYGEF